jgi:Arc/MetJ-type ribon-helix-helix transcriptional regulator
MDFKLVKYIFIGGYMMKETKMDTTEKITININTVDLGYIDLLASEGYYATRTEFIKTAIKKQIDKHENDTKQLLEQRKSSGYQFSIGVGGFSRSELERIIMNKEKKLKVVFVGLFVLSKDITLDLLEQSIESIKVYGVCRCSHEIKDRYKL